MRDVKKWNGRFLLLCLLCCACEPVTNHAGKTPLVGFDNRFLYVEDLQSVVPHNLSPEDSAEYAEKYIYSWLTEELLLQKAEKNISADDKINELVANYRENLILHVYQQKLLEQRLSKTISDKEIENYYNNNLELFVLEEPLIKGLFIKVPLNASNLSKVRRWVKSKKQDDIDELERYSLSNAVLYDYFYDRWVPVSAIAPKMPLSNDELESQIVKKMGVEVKDTAFYYLLNVDSVLAKGKNVPIDFAKNDIMDILINLKQVDFLQKVKKEIYEDAAKDERIKYYKYDN